MWLTVRVESGGYWYGDDGWSVLARAPAQAAGLMGWLVGCVGENTERASLCSSTAAKADEKWWSGLLVRVQWSMVSTGAMRPRDGDG